MTLICFVFFPCTLLHDILLISMRAWFSVVRRTFYWEWLWKPHPALDAGQYLAHFSSRTSSNGYIRQSLKKEQLKYLQSINGRCFRLVKLYFCSSFESMHGLLTNSLLGNTTFVWERYYSVSDTSCSEKKNSEFPQQESNLWLSAHR